MQVDEFILRMNRAAEAVAPRAYKDMMGRYEKVPMMGGQSLALDDYVTSKSLDGQVYRVGEEEKKNRHRRGC